MTVENSKAPSDDTTQVPTLRRLRDTEETISRSGGDIRGRTMRDTEGQEVGKIEGPFIDDVEERVRFIEVASGGLLGLGKSRSLVPVDAITRITDHDVFISHTRQHVAAAPPYDPDLVAKDAGYFPGLYPYYGFQNYASGWPWTPGYPYGPAEPTPPKGPDRDISTAD